MTPIDIIDRWPSAEAFAKAIGLKYPSYARIMKMRGRIPRVHWHAVAEASVAIGKPLTVAQIADAHPAKPQSQGAAA